LHCALQKLTLSEQNSAENIQQEAISGMEDRDFALSISFFGSWRPRRSLGADPELHFLTLFWQQKA
jgi:hypothetical protein